MSKPNVNAEPANVRRKMAQALRSKADDPKRTAAERAEFLRMAQAWEATLPPKNPRNKSVDER